MPASADVVSTLRAAGCVFAEEEAAILVEAAGSDDVLASMLARRCRGLPLEHVVGWAGLCGVRVEVDPGVFVPRRRTEVLAREAIVLARATDGPVVLDLCCGAGALAAVVFAEVAQVDVYASDVEPAAVRCARRNVTGPVFEGDLFDPLPQTLLGRVDVLVANVPYVPTDEIALLPAEARLHEPRITLDGGPDGLDVLTRVAAGAGDWLAPRGSLLVEVAEGQVAAALAIFGRHRLDARTVVDEDLGANVVVGTRR